MLDNGRIVEYTSIGDSEKYPGKYHDAQYLGAGKIYSIAGIVLCGTR